MDITLERIFSLLPRKPDGKLVHGAKAEFARSIGLKGGESVILWERGASQSYRQYLYEIADKYNVSVEWLKGETDIKEKPIPKDELEGKALELVALFEKASPELRAAALAVLRAAEEK
jgi:transcriptional regulator with XRE-family HTH domain